jgi:transposase-like protein
MLEHGLSVNHTTIYRWVQHYAPELEQHCRPHLKPLTNSWRVDETYIKAIADLKASGVLLEDVELRQVKYLINIVEQDHRFIKRLVKPGLGYFSFVTAWNTLQGYV